MKYRIAIQPDDYTDRTTLDKPDASSPGWARLLTRAGHEVKWVDVNKPDIIEQVGDCHGFMWRWAHSRGMARKAKRLLPVLENYMGLVVYPDQKTCWHYDDKIAQAYLFKALGIPSPQTWVFFNRQEALEWASKASFPVVLKLSTGASSTNICLIRDFSEAECWIETLFSFRLTSLSDATVLSIKRRFRKAAGVLIRGRISEYSDNGYEPQSGYALFQEYLPGNEYDTRVTVIGDRCFARRRFNRQDDFRASGSGDFDTDPAGIDETFIRMAFAAVRKIGSRSCALDGLYSSKSPVFTEMSYTFSSWGIKICPGHWRLEDGSGDGKFRWVAGSMWPEEAQVEDYLKQLGERHLNS